VADHPFWAARSYAVGVATQPVPFARLDHERLAEAVRTALRDERLGARAAELGELVSAERGVDQASDVLEEWMAQA
jgi:sterol 3beta-glucosyltransferase